MSDEPKNKLLSLDSSTISLCLSLFPWAKFRRIKGAVKLHLLLDHDGYLPTYALISNGSRHDVTYAQKIPLAPGSIVAMDRRYNDYKLFANWTENGIYFVTRLKDNADYIVIAEHTVPKNRNILADQSILFAGYKAQKNCPHVLRRVVVWDKENSREIVLLTNHLNFGAGTISAIYKDRWQIELFFKAIKQNLKVKTFVGTSENALYIQIWTALIAMLLIKYLCSSNQNSSGHYRILWHFYVGTFLLTGTYGTGLTILLMFCQLFPYLSNIRFLSPELDSIYLWKRQPEHGKSDFLNVTNCFY
jgi:hypothetical protein